jgi:hypothetical protein
MDSHINLSPHLEQQPEPLARPETADYPPRYSMKTVIQVLDYG